MLLYPNFYLKNIKEVDINTLTEEERNIVEEHIKIPLIITNMLESNNEDLIDFIGLLCRVRLSSVILNGKR